MRSLRKKGVASLPLRASERGDLVKVARKAPHVHTTYYTLLCSHPTCSTREWARVSTAINWLAGRSAVDSTEPGK